MSCEVSSGRDLGCKSNNGGLQNVYFAASGDITAVLYDATTGEIESFTASASSINMNLKAQIRLLKQSHQVMKQERHFQNKP